MNHWFILYGISMYRLTGNDSQFVAKLFATTSALLGVKHLTATAYRSQTNGQAERFDYTTPTCPRHYIVEL